MKFYRTIKKRIKKNKKSVIATSNTMSLHSGTKNHPERPKRLLSVLNLLNSHKSLQCVFQEAKMANFDIICGVHSKNHFSNVSSLPIIDSVLNGNQNDSFQKIYYESGDMFWNKHTSHCALLSAGTVNWLTEQVVQGEISSGFALVRPPGHHASSNKAEGFCWFNNVAIAAKRALSKYSKTVKKVLIFDWDVHHGNGTQNIFYSENSVLYISLHRYGFGFYPQTGAINEIGNDKGKGFNVNIPWSKRGFGDYEYMTAFEYIIKPIVKDFAPDLTLISAGFDAGIGDYLGQMSVSPACFGWMAGRILRLNNGKNCVFALEGGYCLETVSNSVIACVDVIGNCQNFSKEKCSEMEENSLFIDEVISKCKFEALETILNVLKVQIDFWPSLNKSFKIIENAFNIKKPEIEENALKFFEGLGQFKNLFDNYHQDFN